VPGITLADGAFVRLALEAERFAELRFFMAITEAPFDTDS
jgi:hypothetical protein